MEELTIFMALSQLCADNPASASLGGFKPSVSAFRFCRHCMGTEDDIQTCLSADNE